MQYEIKIKKLPKSEVELEISLPADFLASSRKKALVEFQAEVEIAGFRKGHVPENLVLEKIGEARLSEEAVDLLLKEHFPKIIEENKFDILGQPKISITKLALGNPVEFKATFALMPEFDLPDYRAIARSVVASAKTDKKEEGVSDKETDDVLLQIRKNKAHFDYHEAHKDDKDHGHGGLDLEKEENLPKLDDEFAKAAGNFKNIAELKEKIKENIIAEKKIKNTEKIRASIMEELTKKTKVELPEILVQNEIEKSLAQMKDDVARMGLVWEKYLEQTKKKEEDLKKDLEGSSEKRAKIQLIFNKIAEVEKIEPNKEILDREVKEVLRLYPNASEINAKIYVSTILINSEVLKLLEKE